MSKIAIISNKCVISELSSSELKAEGHCNIYQCYDVSNSPNKMKTQFIVWHCFNLGLLSRIWILISIYYMPLSCHPNFSSSCGTVLTGTTCFDFIIVSSRFYSSEGSLFWFKDSFNLCFMISTLVSNFSISSFSKSSFFWFLPKRT